MQNETNTNMNPSMDTNLNTNPNPNTNPNQDTNPNMEGEQDRNSQILAHLGALRCLRSLFRGEEPLELIIS